MSNEKKIVELENKIRKLEFQQNILINIVLKKEPEWAEEPLLAAKKMGLITLPYTGVDSEGSYDFYRIIDLINKLGLLK